MTPQLWTRFLTFQEWKLTHPDLTDQEATLLYKAELQLFQNYQDEIRNQTRNRQARLTGDLLNLSTDISNILTEGGAGFRYKADYVGFEGQITVNPNTGVGAFVGSGTHLFKVGDLFSYNLEAPQDVNGIYEVLVETNQSQSPTPAISFTNLSFGVNNSLWKRVATLDGIPI